MGLVTFGAIFGCQMRFLSLLCFNCRPHFLVALLETQLVSRGCEQFFILGSVREVTGKAFALLNRLMRKGLGQHRIVAFIAQFDGRARAHMVGYLRSVRIGAFQTFPFRDRIVQGRFDIDRLVARRTEFGFGLLCLKLVLIAGERRVADGALSYNNRAMQIFVRDDIGVTIL